MRVVVLGAGVIGLTSAWYLAKAGFEVTVLDRQADVALETSFANAGQISYGYSSPWAAPGVPLKAIRWLMSKHSPLKISPMLSREGYSWLGQMLQNCCLNRYQVNKARMLSLANYSREVLQALSAELELDYEGRQLGTLQIFRQQKQLNAVSKDIDLLAQAGIEHELLSFDECLAKEPGLHSAKTKILGGLYLPQDETGDCHLFCQQLKQALVSQGVTFHFDTRVESLGLESGKVKGVITDKGEFEGDRFLIAMGSFSNALMNQLGLKLPLYPVKGYSLTLPLAHDGAAPSSTIMDETYKVAVTRFDDRVRVAGMAELTGFDIKLRPARLATLTKVVTELFPDGVDLTKAEPWTGLRPMTPDGTPIIGATPIANLFTNTGHGTLGWTMAAGSGKLVSDIIEGRANALATPELSMARYG